jgi:Hemerythrin HHE cation binding domain
MPATRTAPGPDANARTHPTTDPAATLSVPAARMRPARKGRPVHPAARLPVPDRLDGMHRRMLEVLGELDTLTGVMAQPGRQTLAAALARDACGFFGGPARAHHDAEEAQVFPLVLAGGDAQLLAHVRRLQQDHNWIEEDWLELEPHLQALAQGWRQEHVDFLQQALPEFTALVQAHITLEETVIYPEARRRQQAARLR